MSTDLEILTHALSSIRQEGFREGAEAVLARLVALLRDNRPHTNLKQCISVAEATASGLSDLDGVSDSDYLDTVIGFCGECNIPIFGGEGISSGPEGTRCNKCAK